MARPEPWNDALLACPPLHTATPRVASDVDDLRSILGDAAQTLSNQEPLHLEGAILFRLIYKYDKKFRHDIGYRNLKKVNTALKRYSRIDLAKDINIFISIVPTAGSDEEHLPTRQMLEYLLVKIQSFSKLMMRICVCTKKTAIFYWDRVARGESHWMSLMPYAVVSRIWSLCTLLLDQSCKWYMRLYGYLHFLQPAGLEFLPDGYMLPKDIKVWLDWYNIDEHGKFEWSKNKCIEVISELQEVANDDDFDILQYIQGVKDEIEEKPSDLDAIDVDHKNRINDEPIAITSKEILHSKQRKANELGEAISRQTFKKIKEEPHSVKLNMLENRLDDFNKGLKVDSKESDAKNQKMPPVKENKNSERTKLKITPTIDISHSAELVTDEKTLKIFIGKEERLRNNGNKQSLTGHLSFMQWQSLKSAVNNLYDAGLNDRILSKKFKKIWKNKCTEYL